ncbi:hypothetical protein LEP1GSC013_1184 [Leptospira interrogans serovar Valbuzzi str. Duyster]|nr:hypothetical protein LEP1GSC013_1184 [Leptospira interrogans serovar Valbuzzi str. Duyster]ENO72589.1 hypothetical protein LEP1GSC012_2777 [Leptospira interrogans serovar Valbuzzi str. Valbuzzi]
MDSVVYLSSEHLIPSFQFRAGSFLHCFREMPFAVLISRTL